jgi:hypothetical protein
VAQSKHLPKLDRISILAATILLVFTLARFIEIPAQELSLQLPGALLTITININTILAVFIIGLTSSGVDWLLKEHPALEGKPTIRHWLLPTLTAWAIGEALSQLPFGALWWAGFGIGSSILILIVIAEYVTVDPGDTRRVPATIALAAVAYALLLILAIIIRARGARLFILVPTLTLATGLVTLRMLLLREPGKWPFIQTAIMMIITGQILAAFHYFPFSPAVFAVMLVGLAYALINMSADIGAKKSWQQIIFEPLLALLLTWGISPWIL